MDDCSSKPFFVCGIIGAIVNEIAMHLLRQWTDLKIDLTQRCIIFNLCFFDFFQNIINIILGSMKLMRVNATRELLLVVQSIFSSGIYFTTFWLVLDRYLHIKLNMMYTLHWPKKKTTFTALSLWSLSILIGDASTSSRLLIVFVVFDLIILLFSATVYLNAFIILLKQKKRIRTNQQHRGISKILLQPGIILIAFAVLVVVPDILLAKFDGKVNKFSLMLFHSRYGQMRLSTYIF